VVGILFLVFQVQAAKAIQLNTSSSLRLSGHALSLTQTPFPTTSAVLPTDIDATQARILPAVGSNAGLVLGATVLVLIIIAGVIISSRWRGKH
jgi:hypothetical protein